MSNINSSGALRTVASIPLSSIEAAYRQAMPKQSPPVGTINFAEMLKNSLAEVEQAQRTSDNMTVAMLLGSVDIHEATVAMEKATLTLRTFIAVRDKMLEAYQEIMRMQI
ncbi:MAG: flagellar hook-basal body complex protein FliE [Symbiobacteriaceae bacterium]|nr:flagellar hook-basal body complex protein FliE [Symbiobacteriaceae bacterium]